MNRVEIGSYSARSGWRLKPTKKIIRETNTMSPGKKPKRKIKKSLVFLSVFLILGFCGFFFYNYANRIPGVNVPIIQPARSLCNDILDPKCWTDNFRPQLLQSNGFTNFLIIGMDTRDGDKGLLNTDTIALASLNHQTKEIMLLSIPRDFYSPKYVTRINSIYAFTKDRDKSDPYRYLKDEVSNITGQEVHYYATVRFDTFMTIIDEFNGIEVCPEDAFTAQYPNDNPKRGESQWIYYDFKEGCQTVGSEKALVYARFRYVSKGPSSLASDFSRARRQQEVIEAIKDKGLQEELSVRDRANRYWSIVQSVHQNVDTNVNFEDLLAGLGLISAVSRDPINVVLDPSFGGFNSLIVTDSSSGAYYIKAKDSTYKSIQKELDKIWSNSALYKEQPSIQIRNWGKTAINNNHSVKKLEHNLMFKKSFTYTSQLNKADFEGFILLDFTGGSKSASKEYILNNLNISEVSNPDLYNIEKPREVDFVILVGNNIPLISPTVKL